MPNSKEISVVIPVYNGEETLGDCLTAICSQDAMTLGMNYEIIVVDDGSTDSTRDVASSFPVRILHLPENQGRIKAREAGALAARYDTLLLLDSRVIASSSLLASYGRLGLHICMAGDFGDEEQSYKSPYDRMFFLLRKKYYTAGFPQRQDILEISPENFFGIPKGTGCLFIDRQLFLSILPKVKDKHVNDDSKLFHRLVFDDKIPVYRCLALKATYLQRRNSADYGRWLEDRGVKFCDFIMQKKPVYTLAFWASWAVLIALLGFLVAAPKVATALIAVGALLYMVVILWLSETTDDVVKLSSRVFVVGWHFWWGVNKGILLSVARRFNENQI